MFRQLVNWSVCQVCGRAVERDSEPDWIDYPWKLDPSYRVVRCPRHWSEKALRNSIGRSQENMMKLHKLRAKYKDQPEELRYYDPIPVMDEPWHPSVERDETFAELSNDSLVRLLSELQHE